MALNKITPIRPPEHIAQAIAEEIGYPADKIWPPGGAVIGETPKVVRKLSFQEYSAAVISRITRSFAHIDPHQTYQAVTVDSWRQE